MPDFGQLYIYKHLVFDDHIARAQTHSISGSVFGEEPNLVQIDNHRSFPAFKPEGTIVMFRQAS